MSIDRAFLPAVVLLLAGCSSEKSSDSGLVNALAQIRAVNLPLADGDLARQPELGLTTELRHNIADAMAPRAFGDLHDGSYRLHAHDFVARIHPDRLELTSAKDPEGVTVRLAAWGRGGAPSPVSEGLIRAVRAGEAQGIDLLEIERDGLVEWYDGGTRGLEHGWTLTDRPTGDELLSFEIAVDAAEVEVSVDAKRAWIESDAGTTWNVSAFEVWDAHGSPIEFWLETSAQGFKVKVDDVDAIYPLTVDPWYTTTSTEIQNTTGTTSRTDDGHPGHSCSIYISDLTGESNGNSTGFNFGSTVRGIGDVNGDGAHDLIVASAEWPVDCTTSGGGVSEWGTSCNDCDGNNGRVFIYNGGSAGLSTTHASMMGGDDSDDYFSSSIITDADFNGDGFNDVLVGIPNDDDGGSDGGALRLFPGSGIGISTTPVVTIYGSSDDESLGLYTYRFGAGDLNGDGYDDLVVGIPTDDTTGTDSGRIIVYMGTSAYLPTLVAATLYGEVAGDRFGESVSVSDVNGDGFADVIVGAPNNDDGSTNAGKVYVFEGSADGMADTASHGQYGAYSSENLGTRLYSLGDINGDGFGDVYMAGDTGDARVYHGDVSGITGTPDQTWSRTSLEAIGDINEDGYDDIQIGEEIKMGSESGEMRLWATTAYLKSVGDFDGDGYTDLAMGDPGWDGSRGRIWIRYGYEADYDVDGFLESEDCDDADATVYPGADEVVGDGIDNDCDGTETCYADADGDGHAAADGSTVHSEDADCDDEGEAGSDADQDDCDDTTALARPGGTELPGDGIDQDCNGADLCYADLDGDGYRSASGGTVESVDMDCDDPGEAGTDDPATDCDDTNATISPAAEEIPANGMDEDCNGAETCFVDADDDGYSDPSGATVASTDMDCADSGEGSASEPATDCDDTDPTIHPAARDIVLDGIDQNCDGGDDCYADADGDGYAAADGTTVVSSDFDCFDEGEAGTTVPATDCDDSDPDVNPGVAEIPGDEFDQDCDGTEFCVADADGDGYAAIDGSTVTSDDTDCADEGEARSDGEGGDCDDTNPDVYPLAIDLPGDGIDTDCDGTEVCYIDGDGDGVAAADADLTLSLDSDCEDAGEAIATEEPDCDDTDASIYPGAPEIVVDGIDQDCDGGDACFADLDGDGYRDMTGATVLSEDDDCDDAGEAVTSDPATDCDDTDAGIYPGAFDSAADGIDGDCDGFENCRVDADGDGHADMTGITMASSSLDCSDEGVAPIGSPVDDCDDSDASVHPGATEGIADSTDQDCDGSELCYMDADSDGARSSDGATIISGDVECDGAGEAGSAARVDCDDSDGSVHPAATETPADGVDSNCDGAELCYTDYDGDGFRPDEYSEVPGDLLCTGEGMVGASAPGGDCDDGDASVNPDGEELPADGIDSDCDGFEQCYTDADGDGYRPTDGGLSPSDSMDCEGDAVTGGDAPATDCDDDNAAAHPDAAETVGDEVDMDCDGREQCYVDGDEDGFRTLEVVASIDTDCTDQGEATVDTPLIDCDDTRSGVNPDATEIPGDGVDQDCDGTDPSGDGEATDTGATDATIVIVMEDEADASDEDKGGCGCSSSAQPAHLAWALPLMGLIGLRRRRD